MKNIYMIFAITIASYSSYGQTNTFPASGNVGIGIINPTEALDINGNIKTGSTANNYLQIGGGTAGTGGYFQGTKQSGIDAGYGTWVNHNAYWNGTNWIQPRGSLSSYLYSSNNHLGFVWKHAVAGGVNDGIIIPIELMRLNSLGKLGIGTGATISAKLHVIGTTEQLRLGYNASSYTAFTTSPTGDLTVAAFGTNPNITLKPGGTGSILLGGNVGIGTTDTKGYKLAVAGNIHLVDTNPTLITLERINEYNTSILYKNSIYSIYAGLDAHGGFTIATTNSLLTSDILTATATGNVGIGTTTPMEKLSVNGKIRAKEIKVENANWPDYVFSKAYELPSLQETEKQIQETGHLPGIPSTAEVKANGVDLGEMNAKLLKKIEELTLYIINQDKELKEQNQKLQQQISAQELRINQLKTKIDQQ